MNPKDSCTTIISDIPVFSCKKEDALEKILEYFDQKNGEKNEKKARQNAPFVILTPNPEIIAYVQRDIQFAHMLKNADLTLPDGSLLVLASRILAAKKANGQGKLISERIAGTDFVYDLCNLAVKQGLTVGLIGGRSNVALNALECLKQIYPEIRGWAHPGPSVQVQRSKMKNQRENSRSIGLNNVPDEFEGFQLHIEGDTVENIANTIINNRTDILFVALGHPKQEYFISALRQELIKIGYTQPIVLMAVGGAFDFISGAVKRAPVWMRQHSLEWLYRGITQPWRLRRFTAIIPFTRLIWHQYTSSK